MTDNLQALFGTLRSLLADTGEDHDALVALLERARALDPEIYDATWRPYIASALQDSTPRPIARSRHDLQRLAPLYPCGVTLDLAQTVDPETPESSVDLMRLLHDEPAMACVERLDLSHNNLGDDVIPSLTTSPHLGQLRALDLSYNQLTADSVLLIAMTSKLPALRDLNLAENHLAAGSYKKVLAGGLFERLEALDLSGNKLGVMASRALAAMLTRAHALETLRISRCDLDEKTLAPILAVTPAHPLHELSIAENYLFDDTTRALLASPLCAHLDWINLDQNDLPANALHDDALPQLTGLVLGDIDGKLARKVAAWSRFGQLTELSLPTGSSLGAIKHLLSAPRTAPLTNLSIYDASLTPAAIKLLAPHDKLRRLTLDGCQLSDSCLDALIAALQACPLEHLTLSNNYISLKGISRLLSSPLAQRLHTLNLSVNELGSWAALSEPPAALPKLRELTLGECYFDGDAVASILSAQLPALRVLNLSYNDMPEDLFALLTRGGPSPLRHLLLDSDSFAGHHVDALEDPTLCARLPRLRTLSFSTEYELEAESVERLLSTALGQRLHRVTFTDSFYDEDNDIFEALARAGFSAIPHINSWSR